MKLTKETALYYTVGEVLEEVIINLQHDEDISFEEASNKVYEAVLKWCGITPNND